MNFMPLPPAVAETNPLRERLRRGCGVWKPPSRLNLVEWADEFRFVALSSQAGKWHTRNQPVAFGPMKAVTEPGTHTVSAMCGTQLLKSELLKNAAYYFIHQDPSPILFVQPTQGAAASFAKERFTPDVRLMKEVAAVIEAPKARDSDNTIIHKEYPGGPLDFVGANSPTDLASRPKRVILADEIDKYPPSAGPEGDPLALAEERASTYKKFGLAKFVRACSPTEKGKSRIGLEYEASDQRRCFVACPHCGRHQVLTWALVGWEKVLEDGTVTVDVPEGAHVREHRPETAAIVCEGCGKAWTERQRAAALAALEHAPDHGWRQTKAFICCEARQAPERWDAAGRSLCRLCGERAPYGGHAGFVVSKLYSLRHDLAELVTEFLAARGNPELLRKFTNTGLAELWEPLGTEHMDGTGLADRAEPYGPDDLPNAVLAITGFCDVQSSPPRLEVQLVGWGADEEAWPFVYEVIPLDPGQPQAWQELRALLGKPYRRADGKVLRVAAFGVDYGGHFGAEVLSFCRPFRGQRVFPTVGRGGATLPIWPSTTLTAKTGEKLWAMGVDTAKDTVYARLKIQPASDGRRTPGLIHFPIGEGFGPAYFDQLTAERRVTKKKLGKQVTVWEDGGKRNEALDTFVGALAVRRSLPAHVEAQLEYSVQISEPGVPQRAAAPQVAQHRTGRRAPVRSSFMS